MVWTSKLICLLALMGISLGSPVSNGTTLVIVDEIHKDATQSEYSGFLSGLESRGHKLEFREVHDDQWDLNKYGDRAYDHVVILPTKARALGPRLTAKRLMEFYDAGGNILAITTPKSVPESLRDFAGELDIHISPRGYRIVDHFRSADEDNDFDHTKLTLDQSSLKAPKSVVKSFPRHFQGHAAFLGNNELVIPLLTAPSTSYVYDAREDDDTGVAEKLWVSGTQAHLAAGLQSRGNARFVWVGSGDLFADGNEDAEFVSELSQWVFQEKSVLRSNWARHRDLGAPDVLMPHLYKVSGDALYEISISEWNGAKWTPFHGDDVQLEFIMLDPYYRILLKENSTDIDSTVYSASFKLPDQYGMFTFKTSYMRPGLSFLEESQVVTVRHTANDEWPRSWEITNSWVYLTSASCVVVAWLVFVVLYLYTGGSNPFDSEKKSK
jgi:oligosaccharyltransferase complex subunit beta